MNSIHDMGGMDGFGPVQRETNEPVFHEPWEGRVFGMGNSFAGQPLFSSTLDAARHRIERLDPTRYLASDYYERWLASMEEAIVARGALSREEIEAKIKELEQQRRAANIAKRNLEDRMTEDERQKLRQDQTDYKQYPKTKPPKKTPEQKAEGKMGFKAWAARLGMNTEDLMVMDDYELASRIAQYKASRG